MAALVDIDVAARLAGMTVRTIRYHLQKGNLRASAKDIDRGRGRKLWFDPAEIKEFVKRHEQDKQIRQRAARQRDRANRR